MTGSAAELWRRMRRLLLSAAVLALSMAASAIAGSWWLMTQPGASREVVVEVPQGRSLTATLHDLKAHGMVPSVTLARLYIAGWHDEPISHWGTYRFAPDTTPVEAIDRLLRGSVETVEITVPEGLVVEDVVALMVGDGIGTPDRWDRALAETELVHRCSEKATSLEGFLFPDTYRFAPGVTPRTVVHHMVERFWTVWEEERRSTSDPWGSCHDVVTLASMVEAETSSSGERPLIAGVFANRLQRSMLLQCDPTVIYALRRQGAWSGRLLRRHWELDDPYNTYRYPGLPPGPINSPGRAAIAAALAPARTEYLFFVANPDGGHTFSRTLREHNRAVARLRRSRR